MKIMLKILSYIAIALIAGVIGFVISRRTDAPVETPEVVQQIIPRPLDKYAFENLINAEVPKGQIELGELIVENDDYTSHKFSLKFDPTLSGKDTKTVTGVINLPIRSSLSPVILMLRGYVDPEIYSPGIGTSRAAAEFAKEGYITIAPDFLGYAESDSNAADVMESRFQTYTTAMSVLGSLDSIVQWDKKNLFMWGHSNGGQIALILLELTGRPIPTTLWAPVSKPFPYSVLYYTDESQDKGKFLRKQFADFESLYDVEKYSLDNFWNRIKAPIQLHQGGSDDAIPLTWSNDLVTNLENNEVEVEYFTYPEADHNLMPDWNTVVERNLEFFNSHRQ